MDFWPLPASAGAVAGFMIVRGIWHAFRDARRKPTEEQLRINKGAQELWAKRIIEPDGHQGEPMLEDGRTFRQALDDLIQAENLETEREKD